MRLKSDKNQSECLNCRVDLIFMEIMKINTGVVIGQILCFVIMTTPCEDLTDLGFRIRTVRSILYDTK